MKDEDCAADARSAYQRAVANWMEPTFVLGILLLVSGGTHTASAQTQHEEYRVKAAFLFHFAQLVEWPRGSANDGPLLVCTFGYDPFRGELESTFEGKQIGGRALQVRHVKQPQGLSGCHVLFIDQTEAKGLTKLIADLQRSPVLTVGEWDGFLGAGGIIRFCFEGNKVRFEINRRAAESAGLKVSSQLLLLAKNIVE